MVAKFLHLIQSVYLSGHRYKIFQHNVSNIMPGNNRGYLGDKRLERAT